MAQPTTIEEAIETLALGLVQSSSEGDRQVTNIRLADLIEAERRRSSNAASAKKHFGLRLIKCVGPGTG